GKNGYEALGPDDFEHTLESIRREQPDLLLLDLNLPVVDGHFICREVRKSSDMPIIIVTSRDSDMDELISMNLGADDFVTKPYNLQILLARIA
ncbi:response regulator, partial [Erysipelatoclostridium ramosum]